MKGTVHHYFDDIKLGTIKGEDGNKYSFTRTNWASEKKEPREGMAVIFEEGGRRAVNVRFDDGPLSDCSTHCTS